MAARRATGRRLGSVRSYTVKEIAEIEGVCRNTVRNWMSAGLEPIDDRKPLLFAGDAVKTFLVKRAAARKRKCGPGELYCFSCRKPRRPALRMVDLAACDGGNAKISALCKECETIMHRFVRVADVPRVMRNLTVNEKRQSNT